MRKSIQLINSVSRATLLRKDQMLKSRTILTRNMRISMNYLSAFKFSETIQKSKTESMTFKVIANPSFTHACCFLIERNILSYGIWKYLEFFFQIQRGTISEQNYYNYLFFLFPSLSRLKPKDSWISSPSLSIPIRTSSSESCSRMPQTLSRSRSTSRESEPVRKILQNKIFHPPALPG